MIYNFMITEYLRKSVRVEAESYEDAYEKIVDAITSEEVVLTADDYAGRDIESVDEYRYGRNAEGEGKNLTNDPDYYVDIDLTKGEEPEEESEKTR